CSELECPEYSACKLKKTGRNVKAICVKCKPCPDGKTSTVCGTDGNEYTSRCDLHYQACMQNKLGLLRIKCKAPCVECSENQAKEHMIQHNRLPKEKLVSQENEEEEEEVESRPSEEQEKPEEDFISKEQQKSERYKKWNQWKQYKHEFQKYKMQLMEQHSMQLIDDSNCTESENASLGSRLLDWFHVLRSEYIKQTLKKNGRPIQLPIFPQMDLRQAHQPYPCGNHHDECREPINFMFHYLDQDDDHILGPEELFELRQIPYENCLNQFLKSCDKTSDDQLSIEEFCRCFPIEPPCLAKMKSVPTIIQRGQPIALPGHFLPRCDVDGFYMPMQCHIKATTEFCWCVDRNGGKIEGSYKRGNVQCASYEHRKEHRANHRNHGLK
ncbi:hypothetical protein QZH41_014336, partial [Actinostola sp. cb2023]